ncbi:hypothetical protein DPMN_161318 [Dreissena polymorpha]|uniref:Uncharacterized protein n=1 Tax=Dreissena polymorpha TaxID=45954 RepID=A0A9D4IPK0_DREPO|nr:hypothetical protein DPMN_161318 [Dreissena polymorpha]
MRLIEWPKSTLTSSGSWFNARRNLNRSSPSSGFNFDRTTVRDRDSISEGWYHYFRELNQPLHDPDDVHSSDTWEKHVSSELDSIVTNIKPDPEVRVLPETVDYIISTCPKRKAGGYDNLQYDHLINAKYVISPVLANIYTWMLRTGHVPDSIKCGVIITMHKGGNKRRDLPDNFRAITLTSVL